MINRDLFTGELLLDSKEKLTFGKYQGRTVSSVMITDPEYLMWVVNESNKRYCLSDTWVEYIEQYSYTINKSKPVTYMR